MTARPPLEASAGRRRSALPPSLPPIGLSREEAAAYIGVGATLFDAMVADGRMPQPRQANARRIWHRAELDRAFAALPTAGAADESAGKWGEAVA